MPLGSTWEVKVDGNHVIGSGDRTDVALPSPGLRQDVAIFYPGRHGRDRGAPGRSLGLAKRSNSSIGHASHVRYGIVVNAGEPREMADLAAEAEAAGWDGVFYYDAIAIGDTELYDPWVALAAMAMRTERVRLGLIISAPARRRPWKLAREAMTIDRLSGGRDPSAGADEGGSAGAPARGTS